MTDRAIHIECDSNGAEYAYHSTVYGEEPVFCRRYFDAISIHITTNDCPTSSRVRLEIDKRTAEQLRDRLTAELAEWCRPDRVVKP